MVPMPLPSGQCNAGPFRLAAFLTLFAANAIAFLSLLLAPSIHPEDKGKLTAQEADAVALSELITLFLPCIALFGMYFGFRGWRRLKSELLYRWQAWASLLVVVGLSIWLVVHLTWIIRWANYLRPTDPGEHQLAVPQPFEQSLTFQAQRLFMYLGVFLVLALAMGLLSPSPDAVYKEVQED